jgi:hypothetical protein
MYKDITTAGIARKTAKSWKSKGIRKTRGSKVVEALSYKPEGHM